MIFSIENQTYIDRIPHEHDYSRWRSNLSDQHFEGIWNDLTRRADSEDILTSSWVPGTHWAGTVFEPLYEACNENPEDAAKFFGLILWIVLLNHSASWAFGRYEHPRGVPIRGLTYFQITHYQSRAAG